MVTVSIIGILAAIAVPSYQYSQAKAKVFEAKANLAALFSAEASVSLDQGSYSACLADIGFTPVVRYYSIGFNASDLATLLVCGPKGDVSCMNTFAGGAAVACSAGTLVSATLSVGGAVPTLDSGDSTSNLLNTITRTTFKAEAVGQISSTGTSSDTWTIDHTNTLSNVTQGY